MRIAALYDIHGNLPALEAVLAEVQNENVDRLVVGGDVLPGPFPSETLEVLRALDVPTDFILGNGELDVLASVRGEPLPHLPESIVTLLRWTAKEITPEQVTWLQSWPATVNRPLVDVSSPSVGDPPTAFFCHATPQNATDIFTKNTPEDALRPVFKDVTASLVVCGHTHMPFDRMVDETRIVNVGSVGMPFGNTGAFWGLLSEREVSLRHTAYGLEEAAARIRRSCYPLADGFAEGYVLETPTAEAMLLRFEAVGLGAREGGV